MKKLKILHVYKSFNVYNGLIEILTILAENFDYQKYELGVCVFEYETNPYGEKFEKFGGKIFNLNIPQKFYNEPRGIFALYDFFRLYKPDIVQTHVLKSNLYGALTAKMANVPVVIATEMTLKDIASSSLNRFRDKLIQPLVAMTIDNCDKFIVTSQYIKNEWLNAKNSHRIEVIYPPFNLEKYDEAVRNPRRMTESVGKRVGFVGRLSEEKSVKILIDAMSIVIKQIPDADLTIVGTGPQEKFLREYCTQLNIDKSVFFTGYRENSFHELKEMDLFVLPSRTEGCPIVILEAMAMGLPVVATRVGGNMELVEDCTTGLLVPHGDAEKMAEAILQLICDKENARNMGQNGRKRAFSQFHPSSFTSTIQMLYRHLFDQKKLV